MLKGGISRQEAIAAHQNVKERDYWLNKLSGELSKVHLPYDRPKSNVEDRFEQFSFTITGELFHSLMKLRNGHDQVLHMVLTTGILILLEKYTGVQDLIIGTPIYQQKVQGKLINTVLALRNQLHDEMSVKELLIQVRQTIFEAVEHQNYPIETLMYKLDLAGGEETNLFEIAVILENIHDKGYLDGTKLNLLFAFECREDCIGGVIEYNANLYDLVTIQRVAEHLLYLLSQAFQKIEREIRTLEIVTEREKRKILFDFNQTTVEYPNSQTIQEIFEEQVRRFPHATAVVYEDQQLTYAELNEQANQLARLLRAKGVTRDTVVGIMLDRSVEIVVGIIAILKAGGAYLPIEPETPKKRILSILEQGNVSICLTKSKHLQKDSYIELLGFDLVSIEPVLTARRPQISNFDSLPYPDRSLVDYEKYNQYIGLSMVKHSISLQATRGCPYNCAYCFKIWSKKHVCRTAENLFNEVKLYYEMGIRRYTFIDDIFNLNMENSKRFFELIIEHGYEVQLLFPAGLRGDILTKEYIDLMVQAGTINMALALETASPRLQTLIGKNLNIERLRENIQYICEKYPNVILDLFTMHGLPTESKEEAMMTLDFVKSLKWIHFPLINVLKIYENTDMETLALENGISKEAILRSENLAWHELSETLPFDSHFSLQYKTGFINDYFMNKERLLHVLPHQMRVLTEEELVQKYNSYLSTQVQNFTELLELLGVSRKELGEAICLPENWGLVLDLNQTMRAHFQHSKEQETGLRILLLDLSLAFAEDNNQLDLLLEPPLGLMYIMTHLKAELGNQVIGKIIKAQVDFDSYEELASLIADFQPDVIGTRTLTYYREFFHKTIAMIRHWGMDVPIIAGGPYATSSYEAVLKDGNIDIVVLGEGEMTFTDVIKAMLTNQCRRPDYSELLKIPGLALRPEGTVERAREFLMLDYLGEVLQKEATTNLELVNYPTDLAYLIFTSGSTGQPKGVMIEHKNVLNLMAGLQETVYKHYHQPLKVSLLAPYVFDASVQQIFAALLMGHTLYIVPNDVRIDGERLLSYYETHRIDVSDGTPMHLRLLMLNEGDELARRLPVKELLIGGEALPGPLVAEFLQSFPGIAPSITNVYGPTECCVDATSYRLLKEPLYIDRTVPIGKPLANVKAYIVNQRGQLQPIGVMGELCLGGEGVGRGYVGKPEIAERFMDNPFGEGLLYRTGDQAQWLPDGNLVFLGRVDHQVKIRGCRIELGEIEYHLHNHSKIENAIVMVRKVSGGEEYLCAYLVSRESLDAREMREYLTEYLPQYMIPVHFITLSEMPLTINGKVDRKALMEPEIVVGGEHVSSMNEIEMELAEVWKTLLQVERVRVNDDFFEMGGHSLKATILMTQIRKSFHVEIPLSVIFSYSTLGEMAAYIKNAKVSLFEEIRPVEIREYYELSSAQKRLFFLEQLETIGKSYNTPVAFYVKGKFERARLEVAMTRLIQRHESLRTSFEYRNHQYVQKVHENVDFTIEMVQIGERSVRQVIREFIRAFDLKHPPLLHIGLASLQEDEYLFLFDIHHIISDGTSMGIFIQGPYSAVSGEELPPLKLQYKDFVYWQNNLYQSGYMEDQEQYWLNLYSGEIPKLNFPTDFTRPASLNYIGDSYEFQLHRDETLQVQRFAEVNDITLYMHLLAVYNVLLHKYTGQEDIIVGSGIAGRRHADLQDIMGMFVNTLAIRNYPQGEKTYAQFSQEVKNQCLNAFEHQDMQFEELVEKLKIPRDPSRNPLFDVEFNLHNFEQPVIEVDGVTFTPCEYENRTAKFDLTLYANVIRGELCFTLEYATSLFTESTMQKFAERYLTILRKVMENKDLKLKEIQITHELLAAKVNELDTDFRF